MPYSLLTNRVASLARSLYQLSATRQNEPPCGGRAHTRTDMDMAMAMDMDVDTVTVDIINPKERELKHKHQGR